MSNKSLLLSVGILSAVLVVLIGLFTPWQVLPISIHPLPASSDFSPADIARAKSFHASLIPLGVGALGSSDFFPVLSMFALSWACSLLNLL
jgi:hypothetical protein